ncbi:hypothetical protein DNK63_17385 [Providencia rettgeri]|nr:hypothetical protein DNK63_17385 [Providencia rettgeri]
MPPCDSTNYLAYWYWSYFALSRCWLHALALVTYLCMLLGSNAFAALRQHKLFSVLVLVILRTVAVLASCVSPSHILVYAPRF